MIYSCTFTALTDSSTTTGWFILNNYKQALDILHEMPTRIATLTSGREITKSNYMEWLNAECEYLQLKMTEPKADILGVEYVELLTKYRRWRSVWTLVRDGHPAALNLNELVSICTYESTSRQSTNLRDWLSNDYLNWLKQTIQRQVNNLWRCCSSNNSGLGYKLWMHISKALQAQSWAIQWALQSYNQAATALTPACPKLTWSQIVEYTTLAKFQLLKCGAREDIQKYEWADARNLLGIDLLFLIHDNNGPQSFSYIFHPPLLFSFSSAIHLYLNVWGKFPSLFSFYFILISFLH